MNDSSPSSPSTDPADAVDPEILRTLAIKFAIARQTPPTVLGVLFKWPGFPVFFIVGAVVTGALAFLVQLPNSTLTSHWPLAAATLFIGAALRDFGMARRLTRLWPVHYHPIDWQKVDELSD